MNVAYYNLLCFSAHSTYLAAHRLLNTRNADSKINSSINIYAFMATQFFNTAGPIGLPDYPSATCRNSTGNFTASKLCASLKDRANIFCYDNITIHTSFSLQNACETIRHNEVRSFRVAIGQPPASLVCPLVSLTFLNDSRFWSDKFDIFLPCILPRREQRLRRQFQRAPKRSQTNYN